MYCAENEYRKCSSYYTELDPEIFPIVVFTARSYACAVLAMGLCLSVYLSDTSRSSTKTAKRRITQTTPQDSPGTLVFGIVVECTCLLHIVPL